MNSRSESSSVNVGCFGALVAANVAVGLTGCGETPGESHIAVYVARDPSLLWERDFATEDFTLRDIRPDVLHLQGVDRCWDAMFLSDFDRQTGHKLRDYPIVGWSGTGGVAILDPPSSCAQQAALERVTLSSGRTVDLCWFTPGSSELIVMDATTGMEHVRVPIGDASVLDVERFGDRLSVIDDDENRVDLFSLEDGAPLWSWTATDIPRIAGADVERLYAWNGSGEIHALSLADGSTLWEQDLGCEWLTYADGLLLCGKQLRESTCEEE